MAENGYITICPPSVEDSVARTPIRRNHTLTVKLTADEWREITEAAAAAGNLPRAAYVRSEALKAARKRST